MLDKQDLQAIREMMKEASSQSSDEIMQGVSLLMKSEFRPQFDLLAEGQQAVLEKLGPLDDLDVLDSRVTALEAMVRKLSEEVAALKKAQ